MKILQLKTLIFTLSTVLLSSCSTLLFTSLDVLRPAKVSFALNANDVLIVNNTIPQPSNYGHTTELINENQKNIILNADSLSIFCLSALAEDLENKNFFASVQLIPNTVNKDTEFFSKNILSDSTAKKLCNSNQANVLISLDKIAISDDLTEYYKPETGTFLPSLEMKVETNWSIHYLNKPDVIPIQFCDTIYWEYESTNRRKAMNNLPNRADALVDGALNAGHNTVNRFIPYWDKVDRYFFNSSNKIMKQAMDSVIVKNWQAAINLWQKVYDSSKNNWLQAQATNNIAIAYEILGDLDKAIENATLSYYTMGKMIIVDFQSFTRVHDYIDELNQRKSEIKILKTQLGD